MPTAIPSGMLCTVTARTNFAALVSFSFGKILSKIGRSPTPSSRPTVAGKNDSLPRFLLCSIDGMRSDHTDAATITPAEKPRSGFSSVGFIFCLKSNTHPAPSVVPIKGISIPINVIVSPFYTMMFFTFGYKKAVQINERLLNYIAKDFTSFLLFCVSCQCTHRVAIVRQANKDCACRFCRTIPEDSALFCFW